LHSLYLGAELPRRQWVAEHKCMLGGATEAVIKLHESPSPTNTEVFLS